MHVEHVLEIAAPLQRLWALTLEVEGWPAFIPTISSVERLDGGPLQTGSRVRLKQPGQAARVWTVTALKPGRRFAWSTPLPGTLLTGVHELEPTDLGTRNTLRVELTGWASFVLGALLRRQIAGAIAQENEGFRRAATSLDATGT